MLILIPTLVFWISNPKSIFTQIWVEKVEFFTLPESWYTEYLEDVISKNTEHGLEEKIKNDCIKCLLLLYFYRSQM